MVFLSLRVPARGDIESDGLVIAMRHRHAPWAA